MTITQDAQIALDTVPGRSLTKAFASASIAAVSTIRRWHLAALDRRATAKLSAHLRRDIGEIDHVPPPTPTFIESEPTSYQDRLEQLWMR